MLCIQTTTLVASPWLARSYGSKPTLVLIVFVVMLCNNCIVLLDATLIRSPAI